MDTISTEFKNKLDRTFKKLLPACDLKMIFKIFLQINNYFNLKDKIKQESRSLLVYNCKDYIGKTKQDHRMQTSEHIGV